MPTFAGTPRDFKIIIDALGMPQGVTKADRGAAEALRERLQDLMSAKPTRPPEYKHIKASWPTGFTKADKKQDWSHHKPREPKLNHLNNSTTQEKIDKVLEGLL